MSNGLTHIHRRVPPNSITKSCYEEGCRAYLTDIPRQKVVIDIEKEFDELGDNRKRCDRMLFYVHVAKNTWVSVSIELKSGKSDESDVREKLENSLEFATTLVPNPKRNEKTPTFQFCFTDAESIGQIQEIEKL